MFSAYSRGRSVRPGLAMAAAVVGTLSLISTAASAGGCPADKMGVDVTKPGAMAPKDVTDKVLTSIDVSKEPAHIDGRLLRLRRLEIKPGGVVPWHSHGDRPAIIYIIKGTITEYASNCAVPIVHHAGEATPEMSGTSHWWKNTGKETVVLLSADLLHDPKDHNM
ncbi:MAG: cupin domain-containing protein [Candidatus Eiseniibacteriota bacterium]